MIAGMKPDTTPTPQAQETAAAIIPGVSTAY